ncbi:glycosyltransferase [Candidatus Dojkabacteria bacterium]|nr:glycosyltransferase [Candidatus Dojkabacteria bacterium]
MNKGKVLMLGWEYAPFYSGGLGIVTRSIVNSLKKQGMDIILVLPKVPFELNEDQLEIINASKVKIESPESIIYSDIEINSLLTAYSTSYSYKERINKLIEIGAKEMSDKTANEVYGTNLFNEVERYAQKAAKIAEKYPHQVIHTHDWMTAKAGLAAKKVSNKPMVMHIHATEFERSAGNPNQDVYEIEREGMNGASKIIAVSERTKEKIVSNYGVSEDKVVVVHNAIEKYPQAKRIGKKINKTDKIVLFLGRLTLQKGAEFLLEAAEKVLRHKRRVKFVFIGHGDMLPFLIKRSIDLGIEKKVMFTGFMDHEDVDKAYQMADVYVMPSVDEPFGITTLEAIKNGTPVIISKQSGVSEVIVNALKVDFWDIDELANQILSVIRYNPLSKCIAQNAEEELKRLDWDKQCKKIMNVYEQVNSK